MLLLCAFFMNMACILIIGTNASTYVTTKTDADKVTQLSAIEALLIRSPVEGRASPSDTILYPIDKDWLKDLWCYILKYTRKYGEQLQTCGEFPRPPSLSKLGNNYYINTETWDALVKLFGVGIEHDLSRIYVRNFASSAYYDTRNSPYINFHLTVKTDILLPGDNLASVGKFPSIWMFPKEETLGYVMNQLKHYHRIKQHIRTRLWFMPDSQPVHWWLVTNLTRSFNNLCDVTVLGGTQVMRGLSGVEYMKAARSKFPNPPGPFNINYQDNHFPSISSASCSSSTITGLLALEVASAQGKWPSRQYPDLLPVDPQPMPYRIYSTFSDELDIHQDGNNSGGIDIDEERTNNVTKTVTRLAEALLSKMSKELHKELSEVYATAETAGSERCERLDEREKYMQELEQGLRTLQQHTDDLKSRLFNLRQQNAVDEL